MNFGETTVGRIVFWIVYVQSSIEPVIYLYGIKEIALGREQWQNNIIYLILDE